MEALRRKALLYISFTISSILGLTTFSNSSALASEWKWPRSLTILTMQIGSTSHTTAAAWTPVMDHMTGMKVRVIPQSSSMISARMLKDGTHNMWITTNIEFSNCLEGKTNFATREGGPFQLRTAWLAQMAYFGVLVRGDSYIKNIYDIKRGTRVANFTVVPGFKQTLTAILAWANVDPKDVVWVPYGSFPATIRSIADGNADLTYGPSTAPVVFEVASKPNGVRFIAIDPKKDPEGAKRYLAVAPTTSFGVIKAGVKAAIGVPGRATPYFMGTRADADPDLIYHFAKWLDENFEAYSTKHKNCKLMSLEMLRNALDYNFLPVHEGTIRYLKEIGKWSAEDDARQKYNVDLVTKYDKAYKAAIAEADKKGINIEPKNQQWIDLWNTYKKDIPHFKVMIKIP
jgi:TRAP transporter TAXI family solute receptor